MLMLQNLPGYTVKIDTDRGCQIYLFKDDMHFCIKLTELDNVIALNAEDTEHHLIHREHLQEAAQGIERCIEQDSKYRLRLLTGDMLQIIRCHLLKEDLPWNSANEKHILDVFWHCIDHFEDLTDDFVISSLMKMRIISGLPAPRIRSYGDNGKRLSHLISRFGIGSFEVIHNNLFRIRVDFDQGILDHDTFALQRARAFHYICNQLNGMGIHAVYE
jgi:hypothetical protein